MKGQKRLRDSLKLMMQHNERESWNLNNRNDPRDHDNQVRRFPVVSKTARDDAEGSVAEDSEGGNLTQCGLAGVGFSL